MVSRQPVFARVLPHSSHTVVRVKLFHLPVGYQHFLHERRTAWRGQASSGDHTISNRRRDLPLGAILLASYYLAC